MDSLTKEQRSRTMSRIRSANTKFERKIFRELRKRGIQFKTHYKAVIGNPDIAKPRLKKAIFLHSDFWHGWRLPKWIDNLPNDFWKNKLKRNRDRDRKVALLLRKKGWEMMVLWEHTLQKDFKSSIERIEQFLR